MAEAKPAAAAQGKGEQDPSMEEILQSIRRIIAEDDKQGDAEAEAKGAAAADLSSDVLELTEMVQDEGSTVPASAAAPPRPAESAGVDVLANIDSALATAPAPVAAAPAAPAPAQDNSRLISDRAAAVSVAAMKKLEQALDQPVTTTPTAPFRSGYTIEDLVMESMRPMLKDWLNANLPAIVERIVEREIKKLT